MSIRLEYAPTPTSTFLAIPYSLTIFYAVNYILGSCIYSLVFSLVTIFTSRLARLTSSLSSLVDSYSTITVLQSPLSVRIVL